MSICEDYSVCKWQAKMHIRRNSGWTCQSWLGWCSTHGQADAPAVAKTVFVKSLRRCTEAPVRHTTRRHHFSSLAHWSSFGATTMVPPRRKHGSAGLFWRRGMCGFMGLHVTSGLSIDLVESCLAVSKCIQNSHNYIIIDDTNDAT